MYVIAHRGNDGVHKENSLEAIINSLNSKYTDGVEFDIRLTKDGKFIICHDLFYRGYFVNKTKVKTLQKQGLNTLTEVLKNICNDKIILIEIKHEKNDYKKLIKKLVKIIGKYNLNYYICSFNYDLLKYFKQNYPNYKIGLIIGMNINKNHLNNNFDFNSVSLKNFKNVKKETFLWTINNPKDVSFKADGIITDKALEIYNYIKKSS